MSKAHYRRQMHSKRIKRGRALAKAKFWLHVARSNSRLNARGGHHGR